MKVIVDTNIVTSGLISNNSYPAQIVDGIFEYKFDVCISQAVFDEYLNVLQREKFQKYRNFFFNARLMIEFLSEKALFFEPTTKINILKDPDDNKFLELAMESNADYLIREILMILLYHSLKIHKLLLHQRLLLIMKNLYKLQLDSYISFSDH